MNFKKARKMTDSLRRSERKKKYSGKLPTRPLMDPFIRKLVYINKNGRYVVKNNGVWQAL